MEEPCRPSDKLIAGPCLRMISAHWLTTGTYICRDAALSKTAAHTWGHRTARDGPRNNRGSTVAQPTVSALFWEPLFTCGHTRFDFGGNPGDEPFH